MESPKNLIQIGIEIVTKATQHDSANRWKEAIYLYSLSIEFFNKSIQEDPNWNRELLDSKISQYEKRLEYIKNNLLQTNKSFEKNYSTSNAIKPQINNNSSMPNFPNNNLTKIYYNSSSSPSLSSNKKEETKTEIKKNDDSTIELNKLNLSQQKEIKNNSKSHSVSEYSKSPKSLFRNHDNAHEKLDMHQILQLLEQAEQEENKNPKKSLNYYKTASQSLLRLYSEKEKTVANNSDIVASQSNENKFLEKTSNILIDFHKDEVILNERLGSGGSGATIYKCSIIGFTFAAKILKTETVVEVIEAIKKEIKIMENLDHINIVKYLGHDLTFPGEIRLYMEYYTKTLNDMIIQQKKLQNHWSISEITGYMFQLAKGLNYLHTLPTPIIHRDLKSENIFVTLDPQGHIQTLKIGDFDSSKILESTKVTYTKNLGTEGFMAPEVCTDIKQGYSVKADIFSLGMVMYELMSLEKPFYDVHPTQKWEFVVKGKKPTLSSEDENKYKSIIPIWKKLISKKPEKRPKNAKKVMKMLSEFM